MSRLAAEYTDEGLPSLSLIYSYLKGVQADRRTDSGLIMQIYSKGIYRGVRAEKDRDGNGLHIMNIDPANAPALPHGATDEHLMIPEELRAKEDLQDYSKEIAELTGIAAEVPF